METHTVLPDRRTLIICMLVVVACFGGFRAGAAASNEASVAGLVVDFGDGRTAYALVPFSSDEIAGMDLLNQSGLALVSLDFGGIGAGVCMIEDVGCEVSACRMRMCQTSDPDSPFWRLMQPGDDGAWTFAALGVTGARLHDGDVNGWYWSGTSPEGAAPSIEDIAATLNVNLHSLRAATPLAATMQLFGESAAVEATNDPWAIAAGAAVLGGVIVAGAWAVHRSRAISPA